MVSRININPLEGMTDLVYILILQIVFFFVAIGTQNIVSILFWVLFVMISVFEISRLHLRLASPWRRLHYPLMIRYAAAAGAEVAASKNENREFDLTLALQKLANSLNIPDVEIQKTISSTKEKMMEFTDRKPLEGKLLSLIQEVDKNKLKEFLDRFSNSLRDPKERGLAVRWFVAEMIEMKYGINERMIYLCAIILGKAN